MIENLPGSRGRCLTKCCIVFIFLLGLSSCGTATGVIGGFAGGGTSLTKRLLDSNANTPTKVIAAIPIFIGGTLAGPVVNLPKGFGTDIDYIRNGRGYSTNGMIRMFDPFSANLFN